MPTCWGYLNTLSRMRFQCHPLHGCVDNELCRDSTVSSSARLGRIWVSGIHVGRTKGRVLVALASFSLDYLPLVLHGLICTEVPTTCSRPLASDHREIIAWICSPWDLGSTGPDAHCSYWSTVLYMKLLWLHFLREDQDSSVLATLVSACWMLGRVLKSLGEKNLFLIRVQTENESSICNHSDTSSAVSLNVSQITAVWDLLPNVMWSFLTERSTW